MISVSKSIGAQNTFTDNFKFPNNPHLSNFGHGSLSISGTWTATITLQRSLDGGISWLDVDSFTANIETSVFDPVQGAIYRAGIKTGDYTNGTADVMLIK